MRQIASPRELVEIVNDRKNHNRDSFKFTNNCHRAKFRVANKGATTEIRKGFIRKVNVAEFAMKTNLYLKALIARNMNKQQMSVFMSSIKNINSFRYAARINYQYFKMFDDVKYNVDNNIVFDYQPEIEVDND